MSAREEHFRLVVFGRDVSLALSEHVSLKEMLVRCAELTVEHLDGAFARIWTLDEVNEILELQASAGLYTHTDGPHARIPVGKYKIGMIARERKPHLTNEVIGDPLVPAQEWARQEGMVAFAGYPLLVEDRLVGVLAMFARHALSDGALVAMGSVANGIAQGIERKRAADALARSEAWLSTTLTSIGDAVIATDARRRVTFLNPIAERMTGWSRAEAIGRPMDEVFQIVNETTRRPVVNPVARVIEEGAVVGLANHTILIARDGREWPIEDSAAPIRDDLGQIVGVVMVFHDVTDKRAAQRRLKESEERYRTLIEVSPQIVWEGDADGSITFCNQWWIIYTGLSMSESAGNGWTTAIDPDHRARVEETWREAVARSADYEEEIPFQRASDGLYRWHLARGRPVKDESGRIVKWAGVALDIHDRRESEARREELFDALEAERRHLRTLIESSEDCIKELDLEGRLVAISGPGRRMLEIHDFREYLGRSWCDLWAEEYHEAVKAALRSAIAGGVGSFVAARPTAQGRLTWWHVVVSPVKNADGRPERLLAVSRDVTERKEYENERERLLIESQEANRAKDQFLAILSHELRTPLNPILLAVTSMLEHAAPAEDLRPNLEMIRQNVTLQARLIDDLLDVMRIVRGKMPLHWEVADGHALIQHAVEVCRSEILGRSLRVGLDLAAEHHHLNADPARLQQVFWNLIKNAAKFSVNGGSITIRTRNTDDPHGGGVRLVVEVSDTGIGIQPEVLPLIFDPFQQGETTITRKFGGLGLGLAISRGIVEGHGGTLTAQSEGLNTGATFTVAFKALPTPKVPSNGQPIPRAPVAESGAPCHILLVEDEQATLNLMARLLRGLGHRVTTANTIASAIESVGSGDFGLIVSDIGLPDGTGLDLMRAVVARRGPVPAIALTGYGMEEDIQRSRAAGFTAHMTKPIDFTKLDAMIKQLVR